VADLLYNYTIDAEKGDISEAAALSWRSGTRAGSVRIGNLIPASRCK